MNSKIIITGATGFVGFNLAIFYLNKNYEVYIIVRATSDISNLSTQNSKLKVYVYDGNLNSLISFFKEVNPICTFHLASNFIAEHQPSEITGLVDSNISFGLQLLEAMKEANVRTLINTGTSWQHYNNEDYNPVCLYAATKQAFESLIEYYVQAENFKVITLKLFDTYGENDIRPKLINALNVCAKENKVLKLSPGEQIINLVHIEDVCCAYDIALKMLESEMVKGHKKYAVKHPLSYTLKEVINLYEIMHEEKLCIEWGGKRYKKREVMTLWEKGEVLPNWIPKITLVQGLRKCYSNFFND